jgi:adenylosuccinate lyase
MALHALSPLDGRYSEAVGELAEFFSEHAYLRTRLRLELEYLETLARARILRPLHPHELALSSQFGEADALRIQELERSTRHDVKAIEYFLREHLDPDLHPWIHFGLTSEDVNNLAGALALRDSRDSSILPALDALIDSLASFAARFRAVPMLARTHGQPAVPTTLGREIAVYVARLRKCRQQLASHRFEGKLTGASGSFNALMAAFPDVDWMGFSREFIQGLGLSPNLATTQILPYDNWVCYFQALHLINSVLLDYTQDIWRYISDGYLIQRVAGAEIGSSTMPQKVNPIDFENAEGNLGVANALLAHYTQKLPISRLQRDLSDSTVRRTFGTALGHTLLAWQNILHGMGRLEADQEKMRSDLLAHWEVVTEGAQTLLRAAGHADAYEALRSLSRGRVLSEADYARWVDSLDVDEALRVKLRALTPLSYLGLAVRITDEVLAGGATHPSSDSG